MDKGKQYIYMCARARTFRKTWMPALGDFYYDKVTQGVGVVYKLPFDRTDHVWLPRADQLLDLLAARYNVAFKPAYTLNKFHQYIMASTPRYSGSIEQMLLQFMMLEVYQKVFLSQNWVASAPSIEL
jgi:hypothetical protein